MELDLRDLRSHLRDAEVSLLAMATDFQHSDDPLIAGMGAGLAIGATEIHRVLSLSINEIDLRDRA